MTVTGTTAASSSTIATSSGALVLTVGECGLQVTVDLLGPAGVVDLLQLFVLNAPLQSDASHLHPCKCRVYAVSELARARGRSLCCAVQGLFLL